MPLGQPAAGRESVKSRFLFKIINEIRIAAIRLLRYNSDTAIFTKTDTVDQTGHKGGAVCEQRAPAVGNYPTADL